MTTEQAIINAIALEKKVREVYVQAMQSATDDIGKRVFKLLAGEEAMHVAILEKQLRAWRETGELSAEGLASAVPDAAAIAQEVSKLSKALKGDDRKQELALLEQARALELETSRFYEQMTAELSLKGRTFFKQFVDVERGHLALVEAEMDALRGMGFWFDMPEFNLENA
ncbi:MAG: ferritin family protein [Myxococcota bacterium]|nr:ferritin family protein [Myxococcota bacterium]